MVPYTFSVIIPTYNRAALLERCLDSLVRQTYQNFEVLVCDDGSSDHSREIVDKFEDKLHIKYLWAENWGGPARPRNRGIAEADGEWICFLDSDDWWTPDKLASCLIYTDCYDLIYHNLRGMSPKGEGKELKLRQIDTSHFIDDLFTHGNPIPNSSVVLRMSILEKIGAFNEDRELIGVEDADYWLRVSSVTHRIYYLNRCLGYYWVGSNISYSPKQVERQKKIYNLYQAKISPKASENALLFLLFGCARILHMNGDTGAIKYYMEVIKSGKSLKHTFKSILGLLLFRINKK